MTNEAAVKLRDESSEEVSEVSPKRKANVKLQKKLKKVKAARKVKKVKAVKPRKVKKVKAVRKTKKVAREARTLLILDITPRLKNALRKAAKAKETKMAVLVRDLIERKFLK